MVKVEDGQVEMVVAEDWLPEQNMSLELEGHPESAEVVDRKMCGLPFS